MSLLSPARVCMSARGTLELFFFFEAVEPCVWAKLIDTCQALIIATVLIVTSIASCSTVASASQLAPFHNYLKHRIRPNQPPCLIKQQVRPDKKSSIERNRPASSHIDTRSSNPSTEHSNAPHLHTQSTSCSGVSFISLWTPCW